MDVTGVSQAAHELGIDLTRIPDPLAFHEINQHTVRTRCMRNAISQDLAREACDRLLTQGSMWASLYIIDTMTNKGARITYRGYGTFDLKVSSRTGEALLQDLADEFPALLDSLVIID